MNRKFGALIFSFAVSSSLAKAAPQKIDAIKKIFPTGYYQLQSTVPTNKGCPPSGQFVWNKQPGGGWALRISSRMAMHIPGNAFKGPSQPDRHNSSLSPCQGFKTYRFDSKKQWVSMFHNYKCEDRVLDRAFHQVLQRRDNRVIIFEDQTKGIELKAKKKANLFRCSYLLKV